MDQTPSKVDSLADAAAVLVPRIEDAYRHAGLAESTGGRLATARAAAVLVQALQRVGTRVHLVETLARATVPTTETAMASSLHQAASVSGALHAFRWDRLAPLSRAECAADQRGRGAAGILRDLCEALTADEFATRLEPALLKTDDAIFEWLASGQPKPVDEPPTVLRPDDVHLRLPVSPLAGQATRAQGAPASDALEPLRDFLEANGDKRVVVEWRVQE